MSDFQKTKFHFFEKKSSFFGFFNQNFENEKIGNKIKKTHLWLDPVSDTTKTVQNIKKTNEKANFSNNNHTTEIPLESTII